jgi:hypothetical protein
MLVLGVLLSLAVPAPAQTAPAPSAPVNASNLDEVFKRFTTGQPMMPTLKEIRAEQLKRDLAPRESDESAPTAPEPAGIGLFGQPPRDGVRRDATESVDVAVSRPFKRLELGVGAAQEDVAVGRRSISSDQRAYGFVRLDLSKIPLRRKLLHAPTATHSEIVVQDDKVHVSKDEYTVKYLKDPTSPR